VDADLSDFEEQAVVQLAVLQLALAVEACLLQSIAKEILKN
jgi:hypothetical protein